jgi:TRAP-type uncharacterized transport system fused permease subunit
VALGAITAAAIAGAKHMSTALLSMRLGSAKYILPFLFVLNPSMILNGPLGDVLLAVATALIGCTLLAAALEGYLYYHGKLSILSRVIIFAAGFLLLYPAWNADIFGFAVLVLFVITAKIGVLRAAPT